MAEIPAAAAEQAAESLMKSPASLQQVVLAALVSALLGGIGTSGGLTLFGGGDVRQELVEVRAEMAVVREKLDDIIEIIDEKHPRQ